MAALAKDLSTSTRGKVSRQSVRELLRGRPTGTCRRSIRTGLATLLAVPDGWLAGQAVALPLMALVLLWEPIDDEAVLGVAAPQIELPLSPRLQLATERLLERCVSACERDLGRLASDPAASEAGSGFALGEQTQSGVLNYLVSALFALVSARAWRAALLQSPAIDRKLTAADKKALLDGSWAELKPTPITNVETTASLQLLRGFEAILEPWFAGVRCLNYARLRETFVGQSRSPITIPRDRVRPMAVRPGSGDALRFDDSSPLALLPWCEGDPEKAAEPSAALLDATDSVSSQE
ncbi:MAG TPA: hypothetical protein VGJ96_04100 [Gemmatimonadaceae bacterium]|jgi:hypothetical protein